MDEKKSKNFLKAAIAVLALCLLGLGLYTVWSYNESNVYSDILIQEKAALKLELQNLLSTYEQAAETNNVLKKDLSQAKHRIKRLLDSVEKKEATYVIMRTYKKQVLSLKKEKKTLFRTIDSLREKNKSLQHLVDSTKTNLAKTKKRTDSLSIQNKKLTEKVSKASQLRVVQLLAKGVALKKDYKTKTVNRARQAEKIEVCFALAENKLTVPGEKQLFVQIINPKNNLLGEKSVISFGEAVLNYSKIVDVFYENERLDVCTLIKADKEDLVEGRYIVNVFMGAELLANTVFYLE